MIGDRRTAALVAADGTLCWMCLPNFDGPPVFGALLDARKGGFWRIGPRTRRFGTQRYVDGTACLETTWNDEDGTLVLVDGMTFPGDRRDAADENRRVFLRHARCTRGRVRGHFALQAVHDFTTPRQPHLRDGGVVTFAGELKLGLWCSIPLSLERAGLVATFELRAGEEIWCVFGPEEAERGWSSDRAAAALAGIQAYWREWFARIDYPGRRSGAIKRSAMIVHLQTFAPTGAVVAAVSTSLPERLGGRRNYDYRFAWVRDASLGMALLSRLGTTKDAERFMDWLAHRGTETGMPLQVLYRIDGQCAATQVERNDVDGYRSSKPVRFGNRAVKMREIGSFGFLVDCALTYLCHGGRWEDEHWRLIRRVADYTAATFERPDATIWEISHEHQFVSSKVMSWVALDRAVKIAAQTNQRGPFVDDWGRVRDLIKDEVLDRGWSAKLGSFRQRYDCDTVDAALLLIPLYGFLPPDHPKVVATLDRLIERLDLNGVLQRFDSQDVAGDGAPPLGEDEGAFQMCTFWLAQIFAWRGEHARADAILQRAERIAGPLGLFSEAVDGRSDSFLGNTPLVFSQVAYADAAMALTDAEEGRGTGGNGRPAAAFHERNK